MLDKEVLKSRNVAAEFKKHNKNTVEKIQSYDPRLKLWTFKRIQTDENASKFDLIQKSREKSKGKAKVAVTKKEAAKKVKKVVLPKRKMADLRNFYESRKAKVYALHIAGQTTEEIMKELNITARAVYTDLSKYKKTHGIKVDWRNHETYKTVKKLVSEGKTKEEIMKITGKARSTISHHLNRLKNDRS